MVKELILFLKYFIVLLVLSINIQAKQIYNNIIIDKVTSIYDGDTFRVNINSYPDIIGKKMAIRVNGIDTPEIRTKCIKEKKLARLAKQLTVSTLRNAKIIELRDMKRGKYFRIVADVYADGKSLADILIQNKLAVKYNGGTKTKNWCK
ncbi:MAG: thermonuclease family protein [Epsilonproteobacteria bacterium]|nr:MAG: thermonuclease family protein [Campylobacterota bacterium]